MKAVRDLSIRRKQMLIIMLTSSVTLLLACVTFIAYDVYKFRQELVEKESSVAHVVGNAVTAAIDFNDQKTAEESLAALEAEPNIISACIYDRAGEVFAGYQRDEGRTLTFPAVQPAGHKFTRNELQLFLPIKQGSETVGTIFITSSLDELSTRLVRYGGIVGLVFGVSLLFALGLSSQLQRVVSGPILHLAHLARSVAIERNYSVRATRQSSDEMGQLIDGFNEMLTQIQQRDTALQGARENLEVRVEERTRELAESLSLLHATLECTTDGIMAVDLSGRVVLFNTKFAAIWQFPAEIVAGRNNAEFASHSVKQMKDTERFLQRIKELQSDPEKEVMDVFELKDGRVFERYAMPQRIGNRCVGVVINWRDITQRRAAEVELAYERDLLQTLLVSSPDHIYFKDRESRFIRTSASLVSRVGEIGLEGKSDFDVFAVEHAQQAFDDEQEIIRTGKPLVGKTEKETWPDGHVTWALTNKMPFRNVEGEIIGTFGISKDITNIKEAEAKLEAVHRQLLETSRQAGMAEVASNVLHNVGNVLNSVNISASLVADSMRRSRVTNLVRLAEVLDAHAADLGAFVTTDPKGKQLPGFLRQLSDHLVWEQKRAMAELESLCKNVEHIKEIVAMQQNYARVAGQTETLNITDLIEDSLRMNTGALERHRVELVREYEEVPPINVEKHKVLQILVNLIRNAKYACDESGNDDKRITVQVVGSGESIKIRVADNGVGIPPENLTRIFNHGFTTRKTGHGFGLHSGALAAKEMGGFLSVHSDGCGKGATFTLELPRIKQQ